MYGQNEQAKPKTLLPVGLPLNVSSIASYCLLKGTPSLIAFILSLAFFIASLLCGSTSLGVSHTVHSPVDLLITIQPPKSLL